MQLDIPFLADWHKIGEHRQRQTDHNTERENCSRRDWDYKVGDQVLLRKDGILRKGESWYESDPWTPTSGSGHHYANTILVGLISDSSIYC